MRQKHPELPSCDSRYQNIAEFFTHIGQVGRVYTNDPGDRGPIPGRVISKSQKMVLDTSLLNTAL